MRKRRERISHGTNGRAARAALLLTAAAIVFAGCSTMKETFGGWFGETPASAPASQEGQIYYAGVEGLAIYAQASSSSKVVGRLAQYERVTRTRTEHGYAFVKSDKSGIEGWVDNALLVWRLPTTTEKLAREKAPAKAPEPAAAGGADTTIAPDAAARDAAEPTPTNTPAAAEVAAPPVPAAPTPQKPSPSMFDPF